MELRRYFIVVRKWFWLIFIGVVLASAVSYVVSKNQPKVYQASTTLMVGTVTNSANPGYSDVLASQLLAKTYSKILTSHRILDAAIDELKLGELMTAKDLEKSITVEPVRDTQIIALRVRSGDPEMAAKLANAIASELLAQSPASSQGQLGSIMTFVQQQMGELEGEISSLQKRIKDLKDKQAVGTAGASTSSASATAVADDLQSSEAKLRSAQERYGTLLTVRTNMSTNYVSVVDAAEVPEVPISPKTLNNVLIAGLVGLLLTAGVIFLIEYLDDTAKSTEMITNIAGAPILGIVSRLHHNEPSEGLITIRTPKSPATEAFRSLRTSIQFSSPDKPIKSLLVTSADPKDGKSFTIANLAVTMAQAGLKVILVDTDLRRPSQHKVFGLTNNLGLTNLLVEHTTELAKIIQLTEEPNLFVITSGPLPPNPSELLNSLRMQAVFERLQTEADLVLFDTPPVNAVTDSAILATKVDGVVLVVNAGHTRMGALKQAVDNLRSVGGVILGIVLNRVSSGEGRYYYNYNYSYNYYYTSEREAIGSNHGNLSRLGRIFSFARNRKKSEYHSGETGQLHTG